MLGARVQQEISITIQEAFFNLTHFYAMTIAQFLNNSLGGSNWHHKYCIDNSNILQVLSGE